MKLYKVNLNFFYVLLRLLSDVKREIYHCHNTISGCMWCLALKLFDQNFFYIYHLPHFGFHDKREFLE
jgi:hypothetical protein